MISLWPVSFNDIHQWFWDFQKKSKCFELPPEGAEFIGIFNDEELIGYFILIGYDQRYVEVNQGYLKKEFRHKDFPALCIRLMEDVCKKAGYSEIKLGTHNRFKAYINFMRDNGYKAEHLVFSKRI